MFIDKDNIFGMYILYHSATMKSPRILKLIRLENKEYTNPYIANIMIADAVKDDVMG